MLWTVGAYLRFEMEEAGLCRLGELGLDDAPRGISIWEGKYVWQSGGWECPQDGSMHPKGTFRAPTDEEWAAIREGRCPWDEVKYYAEGFAEIEAALEAGEDLVTCRRCGKPRHQMQIEDCKPGEAK